MHMRKTSTALTAFSALCLSLLGCASSAAPPSSTAAAASTESSKPQVAATVAAASTPAEADSDQYKLTPPKSDEAKPAGEETGDGLRKASRPPLDLLTGNNVVYVFNFPTSEKGIAAKQQCESADDPAGSRECQAKERTKVAVESIRFVKDEHGQYWYVTYNRYKGNLLKWHKVQFVPGKQDADTISLTLVGKDKGIAPMARVPASIKVELPNDYSIVVSDPEYGAMTFDAKIGLMDAE
jgi:hypothetical protein